MECIFTIIGVM